MERDTYQVIRPWSWRLRRHWMTRVLVLLLPPLVLVGLAPLIIAKTSLRNMVVQRALGKFEGSVTIASASLGWFSPIAASGVTVTDGKGQPLAEVASLKSEKTLLALALDRVHLGTFTIEGPVAHVVLRDDGSNLEDALAPLLAEPASGAAVEYALQITNGSADITAAGSKEKWTVTQLTGDVQSAQGAETPLTAKLSATLADAAGKSGALACNLTYAAGATGGMGAGKATVQTEYVPLALVEAGARRFAKDLTLRGAANCAAAFEWKDDGKEQWLAIERCTVDGLTVASPAYLGQDRIETPLVKAGGRVGLVGDRLRFDRTSVEANLGKATLTGSLKYAELSSKLVAVLTDALENEDCQISGEVDVAELARVLPQTMRLRDDLQITSGHVQVTLGSQGQTNSRTFQGRLETTNLEAMAAGRRVVWDQPIAATLSAQRDANGGFSADINCRSSFLTLLAQAQAQEGKLVIDGDLDKLAQQLQQFFDLGGVKMAGKLRADMNWQTKAAEAFSLQGTIDTQKFALTAPGFRQWTEDALHVDVNAAGTAGTSGLKQIESATVTVVSGGDRLDAKLLRPISDISLSTAWPLQVGLKGELATWLPRLQPVLELPGWDISGQVELTGQTVASTDRVQFEQMNGQFMKLHVFGNGLFLDEPVVKIETTGTLDMAKQTFVSPVTTVAASAIAFRADQLNVNFKPNNFSISGDVAFRGDLARLTGWMADPKVAVTQQVYGALDGTTKMTYADGATQMQLQANIENLALAQRSPQAAAPAGGLTVSPTAATSGWQTVWHEPKVGLSGKLKHIATKDTAELENFSVDSPGLRVTTKGQVSELSTRQVCDVTGQIDYDWKNITQRLRGFVGESVQVTGHESRPFKITGPLTTAKLTTAAKPGEVAAAAPPFPLDLAAEASVGWESAQAYGVAVGKGEIAPKLEKGVVRCPPVDLALNAGHIKVTPWMDLTRTPYTLNLEKGVLAENVQITPEMCTTWLKYMAPLLADVTKAEGRFTMTLEGATIPLNNPYALDAAGKFNILGAQVGPGPLSEQFVTLANQVKSLMETKGLGSAPPAAGGSVTWINVPPQNVDIRVVGGKVYHQGLQMVVKDVVITTTGAVGLDQSLQMTAEVPIRDEWVAKDRLLAGLRGQSLKVPVGGTLSRPQLDWRGLGDLAKQMAGSAARGAVEDQLKKGLERFLPGAPK